MGPTFHPSFFICSATFLGVFILAFPKSEFGETSAERKVNLETIESDMLDNYPEFMEGKIPTKFNFGYFKDGKLFTQPQEDLTNFTERKDTEEDDSDDLDNNCTNPFLGE